MTRLLLIALASLLALPAAASAHSVIQIRGSEIVYQSEDAISKNQLFIDETAASIRFRDKGADNGIQGPANCTAGDTDSNGFAYEMTCPKAGLQRVTVSLGPNEDLMVATVQAIVVGASGESGADNLKVVGATNDLLSGEQGNDILDGGEGNDDLRGDEGNDTITGAGGNDIVQGGSGVDTVDAGEGDDTINVPDGSPDKVTCGGGTDTVRADTVDEVAAGCENVERTFVAPPSGEPAENDTTKPRLKVGGSTLQRISSRRRTIRIAATLNERGVIAASGFLDAGGINTPLKSKDYRVAVAGGGVTVAIKLSRRQTRLVLRDLRRPRKVYVRVTLVGSDRAGNSTVSRPIRIRLSR